MPDLDNLIVAAVVKVKSMLCLVSLSLSLYLSFCKYSSRSLSSPDDKLSENIWFVWSRTSYSREKWLKVGRRRRCHHGDRQTNKQPSENRASQLIDTGLLTFAM